MGKTHFFCLHLFHIILYYLNFILCASPAGTERDCICCAAALQFVINT